MLSFFSRKVKSSYVFFLVEIVGIILFIISASETSLKNYFFLQYSFSKFLLLCIHLIIIFLLSLLNYFIFYKNFEIKNIIPEKIKDNFFIEYVLLFFLILLVSGYIVVINFQFNSLIILLKLKYILYFLFIILFGFYFSVYFKYPEKKKRIKISRSDFVKNILIIFILFVFFIPTIIIRNEKLNNFYDYKNMDATYHVLLTVKAYDATPLKVHKFLPIVTLGKDIDKFVRWGAGALQDQYGNRYYISFPQFGFIFPYLFFKVSNLEPSVNNLAKLNYFINFLTGISIYYLVIEFLKNGNLATKKKYFIGILSTLIYFYSTEPLFSQGPVYWAHSLFQLIWTLQLLFYFRYLHLKKNNFNSLLFFIIFSILTLLGPYTEWTGYFCNFILLIFTIFYYKDKKLSIVIFTSTIISLMMFIIPFINTVEVNQFFYIIRERFLNRGFILNNISVTDLLYSYTLSFGKLIFLILFSSIVYFFSIKDKKLLKLWHKENIVFFILIIFPCIENLILIQHAVVYNFDRLKIFLPLIFIFILILIRLPKKLFIGISLFSIVLMSYNLSIYNQNPRITDITNEVIKTENMLNEIKPLIKSNTVICLNTSVRGWAVVTFDRNVFELADVDYCVSMIKMKNSDNGIFIEGDFNNEKFPSGFIEITNYTLIKLENEEIITIKSK